MMPFLCKPLVARVCPTHRTSSDAARSAPLQERKYELLYSKFGRTHCVVGRTSSGLSLELSIYRTPTQGTWMSIGGVSLTNWVSESVEFFVEYFTSFQKWISLGSDHRIGSKKFSWLRVCLLYVGVNMPRVPRARGHVHVPFYEGTCPKK